MDLFQSYLSQLITQDYKSYVMLPTLLCDPRRNVPQQGINIKGYTRHFNLALASSPQPQCCGLQSPNMTITHVGTTLLCQTWSFTEGLKPGHHVRE
jgi:hypothetical protein